MKNTTHFFSRKNLKNCIKRTQGNQFWAPLPEKIDFRTGLCYHVEGKCNKHGMQCSKTVCGSTGMEAENVAKKHLRGASVASLIPCIRARLF